MGCRGPRQEGGGPRDGPVFDGIPITAIMTMESVGTGTRYVFTAVHRDEADLEKNRESRWEQRTNIALDQLVAHVTTMK